MLSQKCHLLDWYELPKKKKKKHRHSTHKWVLSNLYYTQDGRQIQTAPPQSFLKWLARLVGAHARTCSLTQGQRHLSDTESLLCPQKVLSEGHTSTHLQRSWLDFALLVVKGKQVGTPAGSCWFYDLIWHFSCMDCVCGASLCKNRQYKSNKSSYLMYYLVLTVFAVSFVWTVSYNDCLSVKLPVLLACSKCYCTLSIIYVAWCVNP